MLNNGKREFNLDPYRSQQLEKIHALQFMFLPALMELPHWLHTAERGHGFQTPQGRKVTETISISLTDHSR